MFQTLRNAWKIEDLRKKLLFTLLILVIVRLGCAIPVPFLDPSRLQEMLDSTQGNLLGYLNLLTGGAFAEATLFALGVSPYITASIVIQLLTVAIPSLERMAKEGPEEDHPLFHHWSGYSAGVRILHPAAQQPVQCREIHHRRCRVDQRYCHCAGL